MKTFIKNYVCAIGISYDYMSGQRGLRFWVLLPFKAYKMAREWQRMNNYKAVNQK